ncbi:PfkB family carbohydrate kinase [Rhodococcus sp. NPDC057297]|uniref:PfkB family carbohydrate kinase n=1 Tax=Rhodococcus sp. NPDC057297 TaxID=3346090 RepID=UPI00362AE2AF
MNSNTAFDVVLLGEPLVEISTTQPFAHGTSSVLGVSGDVVNAGAAAAAAGASVALVARVSNDELGDAVCARIRSLGIDDTFVSRVDGQQGAYFLHIDPLGQRQFSYARTGSVGSGLDVSDVPADVLAAAGAVLGSGITAALSDSARRALAFAAKNASTFVYDPNFRPRLTTAAESVNFLREIAPYCSVVVPSAPGEIDDLLGITDPQAAAARLMEWGANAVAVTQGSEGITVVTGDDVRFQPSVPAPAVVDQTGAGDVFAGTLTARIALGDSLLDATALAASAASLSVGGRGGTGLIASLDEVRAHRDRLAV